ncbi:hypothetical protein [Serratia ureilytica]|uniref:hypothetical protein n=1 Tax=Serratia ureilytica TaxID=300181 RepID=UPI001D185DEA|nr:hypothetical protein [Serratia ureilytica]MCC4104746.1 hypothetical protein [Serratia ureilytica]
MPRPKALDNLLRQYAGTHYQYDARGNLTQRWHSGQQSRFTWDLFDRLTHYEDERLQVDYTYDALGRRLSKHSQAYYEERREAGSHWNRAERHRQTSSYEASPDLTITPQDMLAQDIRDARRIYQRQNCYTSKVCAGLQQVIAQNKAQYPSTFGKGL